MASKNQGGSKRGFASMDKQKQREIASAGGRSPGGSRSGNSQGGSQSNSQSGSQGSSQSGSSSRGFASMDPQKQREIASQGGRAAHASGNAHEFNSEEAREAGRMSHKNDGNR